MTMVSVNGVKSVVKDQRLKDQKSPYFNGAGYRAKGASSVYSEDGTVLQDASPSIAVKNSTGKLPNMKTG